MLSRLVVGGGNSECDERGLNGMDAVETLLFSKEPQGPE